MKKLLIIILGTLIITALSLIDFDSYKYIEPIFLILSITILALFLIVYIYGFGPLAFLLQDTFLHRVAWVIINSTIFYVLLFSILLFLGGGISGWGLTILLSVIIVPFLVFLIDQIRGFSSDKSLARSTIAFLSVLLLGTAPFSMGGAGFIFTYFAPLVAALLSEFIIAKARKSDSI